MSRPAIPPFKQLGIASAILLAFSPAVHAQADAVVETETINVFGQGQTRQVTTLTRSDIQQSAPGTSPLKVLEKLPGVSFQSSDPFGSYEWSTDFRVRGFGGNQLGYTLDDVPLGDLSYGNHNGLHISRAISSENIGRVQLSPGTGAVDTASTSNLGGTVQFNSVEPGDSFGVSAAQMLGSDSARRTFVKLDTGKLSFGGKFYASYMDQNSGHWKGEGEHRNRQANARFVQFFGESKFSAFVNWSDRAEIDYQDVSPEMVSRLGYKWDNYYSNWQAAIDSAKGTWKRGETSVWDAYYAGSGVREDTLAGATLDAKLADGLRWKTTVYSHTNKGTGEWWTPAVLSPVTGTPSLRTTEYDIDRPGILTALTWTTGQHKLNAGFWYEDDKFTVARRYYATSLSNPRSPYDQQRGDWFQTDWAHNIDEETVQWHAQDTIQISQALKLNVGFKSSRVTITGQKIGGTADRASGTFTSEERFLPQIGLNYNLNESHELFAGAADNMRGVYNLFTGITQAGFDAIKNTLKPETSRTLEAGWRYHGNEVEAMLSVYQVTFKDRLLSISVCPGIVTCVGAMGNVGEVESRGIEAGVNWKLAPKWMWYNAVSANSTEYSDNYYTGTTLREVKGMQAVGVPRTLLKTELAYDNATWFAKLGGNYTSERFYTYRNDAAAGGYALWNLGAGYRLKDTGMLKELSLQANITNLMDRKYIATVGTNGYPYDATGDLQTLQTGAPRQFFMNVSAKF
jgi:iron complex outermembrane receptor protein